MPLTHFITSYSKSTIIHIADFIRKENSSRRKTLCRSSRQTQVSKHVNSPLQNRMLPLAAKAGSDFRWRTGRLLPYPPTVPSPRPRCVCQVLPGPAARTVLREGRSSWFSLQPSLPRSCRGDPHTRAPAPCPHRTLEWRVLKVKN